MKQFNGVGLELRLATSKLKLETLCEALRILRYSRLDREEKNGDVANSTYTYGENENAV